MADRKKRKVKKDAKQKGAENPAGAAEADAVPADEIVDETVDKSAGETADVVAEELAEAPAPSDPETAAGPDDGAEEPDVAAPEPSVEDRLRAERDTFQDKWLRVVAELDNVRKRARRDVADARRFALADLVRSMLEVQDDLERAIRSIPEQNGDETPDVSAIYAGVDMIRKRLVAALSERGVSRIEALDEQFDPNQHEAVGQMDKEGAQSGQVIEVVQEGYMLQDLVLRPSRVIVAQ